MAHNGKNVPQSPFDRALDIFKKDLTKRDKDNFKITTFQDLQKSIDDLQKKHQSTRRIQDLSRLGVFLEAIEQYTKVVEPFCNSNEIVAFVLVRQNTQQTALRLKLIVLRGLLSSFCWYGLSSYRLHEISSTKEYQVASSYQKAFQELVNTYESIGESLPLLFQYQELFRTKPHMISVLSLIYEDILNFHRLAMKYFQKRRMHSPSY
jgi:tetratricopeptide (TPR) repeat protein